MTDAPEMTVDRAIEICKAINARAFLAMGINESPNVPSLKDVSLIEMMEAVSIVKLRNANEPYENGQRTLIVVPAERLVAAVYVGVHFDPDATPIVIEPRKDIFGEWHMNAVAVVDVTTTNEVEPEKELA